MNRIKEAYTAQELAPLLGKTERGIRFIGKRDNWDRRLRSGRSDDFEYPTIKLPADVREAIALAVSAEERESLPVVLEPATPAVVESPTVSLSHLTARERDVALARKALIDAVCNFETVGKSRRAAIPSAGGSLPERHVAAKSHGSGPHRQRPARRCKRHFPLQIV